MGTVSDFEDYFTFKSELNRIIREGRKIIAQNDPNWRNKLLRWKVDTRKTLDTFNFEKEAPDR